MREVSALAEENMTASASTLKASEGLNGLSDELKAQMGLLSNKEAA